MAIAAETLYTGSTSLAAASWANAAGLTTSEAACVIANATGNIQSDLTPTSADDKGLGYLDILGGSPIIGSATNYLGVVTYATDYSATTQGARIRYWVNGGSLYLTPIMGGVTAKTIGFFQQRGGTSNLYAASTCTVRRIELESGTMNLGSYITQSADGSNWEFQGGSANLAYTATKVIAGVVSGGNHTFGRGATSLIVTGGSVTIDCAAEVFTSIYHYGGTITLYNCGTSTTGFAAYYGIGGVLDARPAGRACVLGSTSFAHGPGLTYLASPKVTVSNRQPIGGGCVGLN